MAQGNPHPTGRRAPGTPNKRTQELIDQLDGYGCDPFKFMADVMMGVEKFSYQIWNASQDRWDSIKAVPPFEYRFKAALELGTYLRPKRKAVQVEGEIKVVQETPAEEAARLVLAQIANDALEGEVSGVSN